MTDVYETYGELTRNTKALFAACWDEEIAKNVEQSPSFDPKDYTVTGRATAEYGGKRNIDWWADHGHEMVDRWIAWREANQWAIWEVEGHSTSPRVPAIELAASFSLPGDIFVKAYIDRVMVTPVGELVVVDIKTGRTPETAEQLGLYACAIEALWGVRPTWGFFWDAQKGEHSQPYNLDMYTPDYMAGVFEEAVLGINAGSFMAKPANGCKNWCGVASACAAVGGAEAYLHDPILHNFMETNVTIASRRNA